MFEEKVEYYWQLFYYWCNGNEYILNVVIPLLILVATYWIFGALAIIVDVTGKPEFIARRRIPSESENSYPRSPPEKIRKVINQVFFNQCVINPLAMNAFYCIRSLNGYKSSMQLPTLNTLAMDIVLQFITSEIVFFYFHRLFHQSFFYKRFHKRHHEWISPIAITAIYCHPLEHVLCNLLPGFTSYMFLGVHVLSTWSVLLPGTVFGLCVHSGYVIPLLPSPEFHDFHHTNFVGNYGFYGILDWLHGTDSYYRETKKLNRSTK